MRKIEAQMVMAVRDQLNGTRTKEWRSGNTCVRSVHDAQLGPTVVVELHGNEIAKFASMLFGNRTTRGLRITDAGWQTNTTKSRLNALLSCFYAGQRLSQIKGQWRLNADDFDGTAWVAFYWQNNACCWEALQEEKHHKPLRKAQKDLYDLEMARALKQLNKSLMAVL